jgi:periplasmic divalent cation tolerance protein
MIKIIITTTDDIKTAKMIANLLVEKKLSPCVQIIDQITSIYRWKNKIVEDKEYLLLIKSVDGLIDEIKRTIISNHNYDVPEIIEFNSEFINESYRNWFFDSLLSDEV